MIAPEIPATTPDETVSPRQPLISIVVPAHNEEAVLERCLRTLHQGATPGEFDVVVIANACSDRTADVARREGVRVIETSTPGKINALHLGDAASTAFPRLYLDADVEIDASSVRRLAGALAQPGVMACSPVPVYDLSDTSTTARRVHHVHQSLMASRRHLAGAGAYALNREGHARVFPLPAVIADDGWVDSSFGPAERVAVGDARSVVRPARTVRSELRRRVRVRAGNQQLARLGRQSTAASLSLRSLRGPLGDRAITVVDSACYLVVVAADRLLTAVVRRRAGEPAWSTDSTSRRLTTDAPVVEPEE